MKPVSLRILPRAQAGSHAVNKVDATPSSLPQLEARAADSAASLRGPIRRVCLVCKANAAGYSCPRCSKPYCSAACYKSHGDHCTEAFFRRHVEAEMRLREAERNGEDGKKDRKTVVQALRKWKGSGEEAGSVGEEWLREDGGEEAEEEGEEEEERARLERLAERLEGEGEVGLDQLTEEQRRRFLADVASGEVGRSLQVWRPWWEVPMGPDPLVVELPQPPSPPVTAASQEEAGRFVRVEAVITLDSLLAQVQRFDPTSVPGRRSSPSPSLRYHLLDVLLAYAYVARVFNGCWADDPVQACEDLLAISAALGTTTCRVESASEVLTSLGMAVQKVATAAASSSLVYGLARDVICLLAMKARVLCALTDAFNVVRAAAKELRGGDMKGDKMKKQEEEQGGFSLEDLSADLEALSLGASRRQHGAEGSGAAKSSGKSRRSKDVAKQLSKVLRVLHKLRFFLVWAKEDGNRDEDLHGLTEEVQAELQVLERHRDAAAEQRALKSMAVPQVAGSHTSTAAETAVGGRGQLSSSSSSAATARSVLIEEVDTSGPA